MCDHENREAAMVTVAPWVWCDPCLAPLVKAINDSPDMPVTISRRSGHPLRTLASCCGHGKAPGRITLADGRELLLLDGPEAVDSALATLA